MLLDANGQPSNKGVLVDQYGHALTPDQPGGMDLSLPYQFTYSSVMQGASRSFIALGFDEAMVHSRYNALAMRRDCRIMSMLRERKNEVISLKWSLEIDDETDPVQVAVRDGMKRVISAIPRLKQIFRWLLEALWSGRAGVQLVWREVEMNLPAVPLPSLFPMGNDRETTLQKHLAGGGELQTGKDGETAEAKPMMAPRMVTMPMLARPVNGDKIGFTFEGVPLVGIYSGYEGSLRNEGADVRDPKKLDMAITWDNEKPVLMLNREYREKFLIHIHDPDDADYFESEKAGGVFGVGMRSRIYWLNWIRQDYAAWIQDLFDRVGLGFIIVKYEAGNIKAQEEAEKLCKKWNRRSVLAVPVSPDMVRAGGGVEVVEVPTAGANIVQGLITELCDKWIERYMVGQSMSAGQREHGMGGTTGPADMAGKTKAQLTKGDAEDLEETLTGHADEPGLCWTIQKWGWPGTIDKFRVRFRFMVDDADPGPKIDAIVALAGAGVEFGQDSARKLTGEPAPKEGEKTFGGKTPAPAMPGQPPIAPEDGGDAGEPPAKPPMNGKPPINGKPTPAVKTSSLH